jgi:DNA-binding transcriptional LysR family regulator
MEIRQIRHFVAVAETLSFSQAADKVNLTQQAVSKSIGELEKRLSIKLLERSKHTVALTESAKLLLPYMYDMLSKVEHLNDAVSDITGVKDGNLRIGATPTFLHDIVLETLLDFQKEYPNTKIALERGDFHSLSLQLQQGKLDLVLSTEPEVHLRHLISLEKIGEDQNIFVVRAEHPLAKKETCELKELLSYPMLKTQNYPLGEAYLGKLLEEQGLTLNSHHIVVGSSTFGISWIRKTDHWWIVPSRRVMRSIEQGELVQLDVGSESARCNLVVATRRHSSGSKWMHRYAQIVKQYLLEHEL